MNCEVRISKTDEDEDEGGSKWIETRKGFKVGFSHMIPYHTISSSCSLSIQRVADAWSFVVQFVSSYIKPFGCWLCFDTLWVRKPISTDSWLVPLARA